MAASLIAADHLHELPGSGVLRGGAALALAFAVARDGRSDVLVAAFTLWFTVVGAVAIAGPLWQRYAPTSDELRILIDPVSFTVAVASEVLLVIAGLTLLAARR
jgi:hypothetical protein